MNNNVNNNAYTPPKSHASMKYEEGQAVLPRKVHVIINPAAGQEQPILGLLNTVFKENDIEWEAFVTHEAGDARRYAQKSAAEGVDAVMACGGDGTIMETASGLRGTSVPLAILPCGTGNVMSIEMSIPADLHQAVALVAQGQNVLRGVDMGLVNDTEFLLRVAVGMEARMVVETPRESKSRWGNMAYFITALNQLANLDVARYYLDMDGVQSEAEGVSMMIANSVNMGVSGINLVQNASVSDGLLDVVVIQRVNLPSLVALATNTLLNLTDTPSTLLHWQAREVRVRSEPLQPAQVDGEAIPANEITARVLPKAVNIICPLPPSPDTAQSQSQ